MRHRKKTNPLSRKSAHRKAMMANMATSLILNKRIKTTVAKAKALRTYIEPLITRSKTDTTHSRRVVFSYLKNKHAVSELFREVAQKVATRPGGYTRILKTGNRMGDNAEMCIIELVDYNEAMLVGAEEEKPKPTRRKRRRRRKKSSSDEMDEIQNQDEQNDEEVDEDDEYGDEENDDVQDTDEPDVDETETEADDDETKRDNG